MDAQVFLEVLSQYGLIVLFIFVFLEYMSFPILPTVIVLPAVGILISQNKISLIPTVFVAMIASLLGSSTLYGISYLGGATIIPKLSKKSPKFKKLMDKSIDYVNKNGNKGLFFCRLIPVLRTIVAIPAGFLKKDVVAFTFYSTLGIFCWNFTLILLGWVLGYMVFRFLG